MAGPYLSPSRSIGLTLVFLICSSHGLYIPAEPRGFALSDGDGTGNVCKKQVAPFPTFKSIGIRNPRPCGPTTPYYTYVVGQDATQRTVQNWWNGKAQPPTTFKGTWTNQNPVLTCEHVLELNILKAVMESTNGPCDQIAKLLAAGRPQNDPAILALWQPLRTIINSKANLALAAKDTLEKQKSLVATYAQNGNQGALGVTGITGADAVGLLKAANDYLQKTKDGSDVLLNTDTTNTISVATQLDAAIAANPNPDGPVGLKVVDEWNRVLAAAKSLA
ncbi:hypothetical protein DFH06DRAFT_1477528 [Mycena polygramma]|nr:hypothetical protein DFH06DRAFT_1477528 [Mycena polygramma]